MTTVSAVDVNEPFADKSRMSFPLSGSALFLPRTVFEILAVTSDVTGNDFRLNTRKI